jgi:hypothetical protein
LAFAFWAGDSCSGKLIIHRRAESHGRKTVKPYIHSAIKDIKTAANVGQMKTRLADLSINLAER